MARRQEPAGLVSARGRLRELAAAQQSALGEFWQAADTGDQLRAQLEAVEAEQRRHAGALAGLVGAAVAAELTGWSRARVVEAERAGRPATSTGDPFDREAKSLRRVS